MDELKIDQSNFKNVYKNIYLSLLKLLLKNFKFRDYVLYFYFLLSNLVIKKNLTLQEGLDKSLLSTNAKKLIKMLSITVIDHPNHTNLNDFGTLAVHGLNPFSYRVKQLREPNIWHEKIDKYLKKKKM